MSTESFYADLLAIENLLDATNQKNFTSVPADWYVVITDIIGSTKAIESGRYKEINLIGAGSIAALLNIAGTLEIPYVFGGDGATLLIPPSLLTAAKQALLALQHISQVEFDLELRIGFVPIPVVLQAGFKVQIAKLRVSENYYQAVFTGGGLNYATDLVKNPASANLYRLQNTGATTANFSGLECRWQDVPSRHGETISLLVLAMAHTDEEKYQIYHDVIQHIYEIYGDDEDFHPIAATHLKLALTSKKLLAETKLRAKSSNWLDQWLYLSQIQFENLLGLFLMAFKVKAGEIDWSRYKQIVTAASDYKKFDDMLRMTIAGNAAQREKLTNYLESRYREGKIVHGMHVSDRALMTCLVFERNGRQVHFIDAADGGYTLAAKPMKARMSRKMANWKAYTKLATLRNRARMASR